MEATMSNTPQVGQVWKPNFGGPTMQIVAIDGRFAFMKRADESKKSLANPSGGYATAFSEFSEWTLIP
jgi:hypothetical protein